MGICEVCGDCLTESPRSAQALLELVLPVDVRESIAGDLGELFQRECRRHGVRRARLRYSRQALSFAMRFAVERCFDWRRENMMRTRLSWMDMKLGLRMLIKYPGLTLLARRLPRGERRRRGQPVHPDRGDDVRGRAAVVRVEFVGENFVLDADGRVGRVRGTRATGADD